MQFSGHVGPILTPPILPASGVACACADAQAVKGIPHENPSQIRTRPVPYPEGPSTQ